MRHFLLSFSFFVVFFATSLSPANAQIPRTFSYQGVVIDGSGKFISDGPHNIQIFLYDALGAGFPLYSENQTGVVFVKGLFNVMIGSVTTIPSSVTFDKGYFLGIAVDGAAEMTPRTAISPAPYALYAAKAGSLAPGAKGVVTSVNTQEGAITIKAGSGTVITNDGATITVNSTGVGGTGIQGVQNGDASITIANAAGPVASISVANGGITTAKIAANAVGSSQITNNAVGTAAIADGAVTLSKINSAGATNGKVLTSNGSTLSWQTPPGGGLVLPFSGSVSNAGDALSITNTGAGRSGLFSVSNVNSTAFGLTATSNGAANSVAIYSDNSGSGRSGFFEITSTSNSSTALSGKTQGLGVAADIIIANTTNSSNAFQVSTNGTGSAGNFQISNTDNSANGIEVATAGTGISGRFANSNSANTNPTLAAINASTSSVAVAVYGEISNSPTDAGTGAAAVRGVHSGTSSIGSGVWGSQNGSGNGVLGTTATGNGVEGLCSGNGVAILGKFAGTSTSGTALQLDNGYMKVSGNTKTAFVHATAVANILGNRTFLNYPGMLASDIVIAVHSLVANALKKPIGGIQEGISYGVWWNVANNRWEIYLEDQITNMPVGENFNVLVIKQ